MAFKLLVNYADQLMQVSITTSSNNVDAGDAVNITVQTSSFGAYVGLRAIDKSVLLLRSGNDISRERVRTSLHVVESIEITLVICKYSFKC